MEKGDFIRDLSGVFYGWLDGESRAVFLSFFCGMDLDIRAVGIRKETLDIGCEGHHFLGFGHSSRRPVRYLFFPPSSYETTNVTILT